MLVLIALALFFLTALVTYNPLDPGWSYTGPRNGIDNAAGVVGAWIADVLFSLFGYLAYLLPVMIAYSGWLVMRGARSGASNASDDDIDYRVLGLRWSGFFVTLASGCALTSLHFVIPADALPIDGGGILGQWLGDSLAGVLGLLSTSGMFVRDINPGVYKSFCETGGAKAEDDQETVLRKIFQQTHEGVKEKKVSGRKCASRFRRRCW